MLFGKVLLGLWTETFGVFRWTCWMSLNLRQAEAAPSWRRDHPAVLGAGSLEGKQQPNMGLAPWDKWSCEASFIGALHEQGVAMWESYETSAVEGPMWPLSLWWSSVLLISRSNLLEQVHSVKSFGTEGRC
eukprot:Skav226380  [mRNA]  locus=scaffold722:156631:157023:+ [translate_table: standard]